MTGMAGSPEKLIALVVESLFPEKYLEEMDPEQGKKRKEVLQVVRSQFLFVT